MQLWRANLQQGDHGFDLALQTFGAQFMGLPAIHSKKRLLRALAALPGALGTEVRPR